MEIGYLGIGTQLMNNKIKEFIILFNDRKIINIIKNVSFKIVVVNNRKFKKKGIWSVDFSDYYNGP